MDSKTLEKEIEKIKDFFEIKTIGRSVFGEKILAINKVFSPDFKWALIVGGIHAREHLSCDLICEFLWQLKGIEMLGHNLSFVPLLNPDGANICLHGVDGLAQKDELLKINRGSDFSLFKANGRGVDLNNNFDANFDKNFSLKTAPSSQGYYGEKPFSEPETKAIKKWTEKIHPFLAISYHLKGEEIYFDFFQDEKRYQRDYEIAKVFALSTGYKTRSTQELSSGGFKDWCVQKLKISALTIELGDDRFSHPYPKEQLPQIYEKNKNIFKDLENALKIFEKYS